MIPKTDTVLVENNFSSAGPLTGSRRMDIDAAASAYVIKMIIDLYGDKELAVLRELATNARDSHVMAGRADVPIEVELPGPLSPYLVIRDYGLGLSVEEIYGLFGRIGASTKRETNDATGVLGVGSKSPLTYTNQFTMRSNKDGVRAVVSISRDTDGVGTLTVVDTASTSEPNGVELKIPAAAQNSFAKKAEHLFRFWKPGTVKLNAQYVTGLKEAMWVASDIALLHHNRQHYTSNESYVVMGNVPYPAPALGADRLGLDTYAYSIVAFVPIGTVEFVPSREALMEDDPDTRKALASIQERFKSGLEKAIQKEIEEAKTARDALLAVKRWSGAYRRSTHNIYTWRGKALPASIRPHATGRFLGGPLHSGGRRGKTSHYGLLQCEFLLNNTIFVLGFDGVDVTATCRKKLAQLANERGLRPAMNAFWLDWDFSDYAEYCDPQYLIKWEDVKAAKLPKQPRTASSRIPGSFDVVYGGSALTMSASKLGVPGDELDQNNPIYHLHGNLEEGQWYTWIMDQFHARYTLICLPENRLVKFRRENPQIKDLKAEIRDRAKKLSDKMTEDEKKALWLLDNSRNELPRFVARIAEIDDPDLKELVRLSKIDLTAIKQAREKFRGEVSWPSIKVDTSPLRRYPYLRRIYDASNINAHAMRYMNSEYAYLLKEGKL